MYGIFSDTWFKFCFQIRTETSASEWEESVTCERKCSEREGWVTMKIFNEVERHKICSNLFVIVTFAEKSILQVFVSLCKYANTCAMEKFWSSESLTLNHTHTLLCLFALGVTETMVLGHTSQQRLLNPEWLSHNSSLLFLSVLVCPFFLSLLLTLNQLLTCDHGHKNTPTCRVTNENFPKVADQLITLKCCSL